MDLYEGQNLALVQMTIFKLGGMAQKKNFAGPAIGVKVASANKRNFSEDKLREGQSIIGLQVSFLTRQRQELTILYFGIIMKISKIFGFFYRKLIASFIDLS